MENFILPEKWYITSKTTEEDNIIVDYFNKTFNITISKFIDCHRIWYYSNTLIDVGARDKYDDDSFEQMEKIGCIKITYEQFEQYVLNKTIIQESYKPDLELDQILIKLLSNDN